MVNRNAKKKLLLQILYLNRLRRHRNKRKIWSYQWLINRKEKYVGSFNLMAELDEEQPEEYYNFVRMNSVQFNYLAKLVTPILYRKDTNWRKAISVKMRLAITLRFLATGAYI